MIQTQSDKFVVTILGSLDNEHARMANQPTIQKEKRLPTIVKDLIMNCHSPSSSDTFMLTIVFNFPTILQHDLH